MVTKSIEVTDIISPSTLSTHQNDVRFYSTKTFRLLAMLSLTFSFFIIELVVGNITNSLALVADAFHMLSDVISLLIGLFAVRIAKRRSNINTFGWVRAEIVGANINTVFLLALCLTIVLDTIKRYIEPEPIVNINLLLIVGSIGLGINIIGLFLFQGFHGHTHGGGTHGHSHNASDKSKLPKISKTNSDTKEDMDEFNNNNTSTVTYSNDIEPLDIVIGSTEFKRHSFRALDEAIVTCTVHAHDNNHSHSSNPNENAVDFSMNKVKRKKGPSMNMHGVFLHILADALGSIVVIISALIVKFVPHNVDDHKHWTIYVDPTLSLLIVIIITISAIPLLKESTFVLLQTAPQHIEIASVKKLLLDQVPEIEGIHELHIWRLTSNAIIATAHLRRRSLTDYMTVANRVKHFFHSIGIHSTTIQYEYQDDQSQDCSINTYDESNESKSANIGCLLSCPDNACDTQTCCTKDLIRKNAVLNMTNDDINQENVTNTIETRIKMENKPLHMCSTYHNTHTQTSEIDSLLKNDGN